MQKRKLVLEPEVSFTINLSKNFLKKFVRFCWNVSCNLYRTKDGDSWDNYYQIQCEILGSQNKIGRLLWLQIKLRIL